MQSLLINREDTQMINDPRIKKVLYGGDYNPEQWPEEVWEEHIMLEHVPMRRSIGNLYVIVWKKKESGQYLKLRRALR